MLEFKHKINMKRGIKMSDQNSFHFIGRLTKSAELKHVGQDGNTACVKFCLAVNSWNRAKKTEEASFFNFTFFGPAAENVHKYLCKGMQVSVKGFCKQDKWESNGQKYYSTSFIVTDLQLLSSPKKAETSGEINTQSHAESPENGGLFEQQYNENGEDYNYYP